MRKLISLLIVTAILASVLSACGDDSISGKKACAEGHTRPTTFNCAEGVYCTVCGEMIEAAGVHTPGEPATCTADQICTKCGAVIEKSKGGHTPDGEATCTKPSTCTLCGEVIAAAKGHTPGAEATATTPQTCTVCGEIIAPAKGNGGSISLGNYVAETTSGGHYIMSASKYNNSGTVLCCGNYLMEYFGANKSGSQTYADKLNAFAKKYPELKISNIIVPKCASFQSPSDRDDQFENHKSYIANTYAKMSGVTTVDAFGEMAQHRNEYLFYRTDHHWTSLGAYYASVAYCKANGITPKSIESYRTVVNFDFTGTLYSTYWGSNKPATVNNDYTVGHIPSADYTFMYSTSGTATSGTNSGTAIRESAKSYASMFICGDQPFTDIKTSLNTGRKAIVFKESYGNAFVPYLIDYFDEIIVIDNRSYKGSINTLINKYGITHAIVINNIQASASGGYLGNLLVS